MFQGKNVLVTGGASGIGAELSRQLARRGARVWVTDIDEAKAREVAASLPEASFRRLDVTNLEEFRALAREMREKAGRIDFLFNNAGVAGIGEFRQMDMDEWRRILQVDFWGVLHGVDAVYSGMVEQRSGHIVNTASSAGLMAVPLMAPYCAAKHAVVGLSRTLRAEAATFGVRVSVVCPGLIRTPIVDVSRYFQVDKDKVLSKLPFRIWEVDEAVRRILKGVERNEGVIAFPFYIKLVLWTQTFFPRIADALAREAMRRTSKG